MDAIEIYNKIMKIPKKPTFISLENAYGDSRLIALPRDVAFTVYHDITCVTVQPSGGGVPIKLQFNNHELLSVEEEPENSAHVLKSMTQIIRVWKLDEVSLDG